MDQKTIDAVIELCGKEDFNEIVEIAVKQRIDQSKEVALQKELSRLRNSVGRLYGHFTNVLRKWNIAPLTNLGQEMEELSNTPAPLQEVSRVKRYERKRGHAGAPTEEVILRRNLMEKQLQARPSTIDDIIARLRVEGFPVNSEYYQCKNNSRRTVRIRACLHSDLHLLVHKGAVSRAGTVKSRLYSWVKDVPNKYSGPKPKVGA